MPLGGHFYTAANSGKKRFYKDMLDIADEQYQLHLTTLGDKSNG